MSNETSRVEAAAEAMWNSTEPPIKWEDSGRLGRSIAKAQVTAALAASDADDLANGIRRVRVDEAQVERVARKLHPEAWDLTAFIFIAHGQSREHALQIYQKSALDKVRAVLAAATDGADG